MDIELGEVWYHHFTTRSFNTTSPETSGEPSTLLGDGSPLTVTVSMFEDNSATPITNGVTVLIDLNSVAGLNSLAVNTGASPGGYEAGKQYSAVITSGNVAGRSVVGEVIGKFSIGAEAAYTRLGAPITASISADIAVMDALIDTLITRVSANVALASVCTEARLAELAAANLPANIDTLLTRIAQTLNLTASGNIGIDWANVENPSTVLDLAATVIQLVDTCTTNTDMRGTDSANTVVPDAAGTAPTAIENRQEMDSNSVDLNSIITALGTAGAGLTDLGGMSTAMKAEILVEVNAALDTAISELGVAIPTATPTVRTALMLMYMMTRNKLVTQTSATDALEVYNDAGTLITKKLITDAAGDYTEAEMS